MNHGVLLPRRPYGVTVTISTTCYATGWRSNSQVTNDVHINHSSSNLALLNDMFNVVKCLDAQCTVSNPAQRNVMRLNPHSTNPIGGSVAVWSDARTRSCIRLSMGGWPPSRHTNVVNKLLPTSNIEPHALPTMLATTYITNTQDYNISTVSVIYNSLLLPLQPHMHSKAF